MPTGVGGGILSSPPVQPAAGTLWAFVNGSWQPSNVAGAYTLGGSLSVAGKLMFGAGSFAANVPGAYTDATLGLVLVGSTGSTYDLTLATPGGSIIFGVTTGTLNLRVPSTVSSSSSITGGIVIGDGATAATNIGFGGGQIFAGGNVNAGAAGVFKVNGAQVVGARITGYGTPTGNVQTASFPGATATLAQTSAELAQLILDLKTHGLLGT